MPEGYTKRPVAALVIYDLRDPKAFERARRERQAWVHLGRGRTEIHTLDNDHIVIEFRAGGAVDLEAAS